MKSVTLPFAETFSDIPSSPSHSPIPLNDPLQFPLLSSTGTSRSSDTVLKDEEDWEMISTANDIELCTCNDDSDGSIVWIDRRSTYVEVATKAGVNHDPIYISAKQWRKHSIIRSTHGVKSNIWKQSFSLNQENTRSPFHTDIVSVTTTESQKQLKHLSINKYDSWYRDNSLSPKHTKLTVINEVQEAEDDPWYQCKHMKKGNHKHDVLNICRRKQKILKIAFRHAAHNYLKLLSKQHKRKNPKKELEHAQKYLSAIEFLRNNLQPRFYVKGDRKNVIKKYGYWCSADRYYSGRMQLSQFKEAFYNDPVIREVLLGLIHTRLYSPVYYYWNKKMLKYNNDKESWPTWIEYVAYCYEEFIYSDLSAAGYTHKSVIIPALRDAYKQARKKWMIALINRLPSFKDKSGWRINRSQFAQCVLSRH